MIKQRKEIKIMKVKIIQPLYSKDIKDSDELFTWELKELDSLDEGLDLVVFPESCDVPAFAKSRDEMLGSINAYMEKLRRKAEYTARRTHTMIAVNYHYPVGDNYRNTTVVYDREGREAAVYDKQHLTPGEVSKMKLDSDYTFEYNEPYVAEIEGIRFGFLTCYDFYFYELYAAIARKNVDIIIGCSHQRTDSFETLRMLTSFCAYHTNSFVLRSSVSMGNNGIGGSSMIVAPSGKIIADFEGRVGSFTCEIDPHEKFVKPAGFGGDLIPHYEYIERGRRPWKYRPAGPFIARHDAIMPYPRTCAHRGFSTVLPENSLPAFGAAVALGADEIEFDIWATKDGELVSVHDSTLDRVSDGTGNVWDYTYDELSKLDFGAKHREELRGLRILRFEEILKRFSCHTVMNIHIKSRENVSPYNEDTLRKIVSLIRQYDCEKYVYFMSGNRTILAQIKSIAPDLAISVGAGDAPYKIVDDAIALGAEKVQLMHGRFNREMIDKAHQNGIICNVFYADDEETCRRYLDMGIDTILTNNFLKISEIVKEYVKK